MERLTIKMHKGTALKMADAYDSQDSAGQDLMERVSCSGCPPLRL